MQIGDKVRMLRDKEAGRVTKIISDKLVEVEIEDGFRIPVLRTELVLVAAEESNYFDRAEPSPTTIAPRPTEPTAAANFALAFHALNDKDFSVYLINNTSVVIPFSVYYQKGNAFSGKLAGHLKPKDFVKIDELDRRDFNQWPEIVVQALLFEKEQKQVKAPLEKHFKFKASSFFKNEKVAPVILKKAYIFEIDTPLKTRDIEKLTDRLSEGSQASTSEPSLFERPDPIVDLHIEKLRTNIKDLSSQEILQIQLSAFEKALDSAIAGGLEEITFIHGVGNGVLRDNLHKKLSQSSNIEYFKDALREKFGYGATVVKFK